MLPDHGDDRPGPPDSGAGFSSRGTVRTRAPDARLAGLADAVTRDGHLAGLSDDELIDAMGAWRRLQSWSSSGLMAVVAELTRRRPADGTPPAAPGEFPVQISEFVSDEIAAALTLTPRTADAYQDLALDLAVRLPGTARALYEGVIDRAKAR